MADAYGAIIVCGDYRGEIDKLVDVLNSLDWTSDCAQFVRSKDSIWMREYGVQYPTVFPTRDILIFGDGRKLRFDHASAELIKEWENDPTQDISYEGCSLEEFADLIAPLMTGGTLEIVASGNEKSRYAYFERLIIRSDGSAERHRSVSDFECGTESRSEYFEKRAA